MNSKKDKIKTKFSVLMSTYKNDIPSDLKQALDSIYNNTLSPDEVILVIDGEVSKELLNLIKRFERDKKNLIIIKNKKNIGLGLSLKKGLLECKNDLIFRMDSDDVSNEDRFEKQVKFMNENLDVSVCGGQISEFFLKLNDTSRYRIVNEKPVFRPNKLFIRSQMNHVTVCFRKKVILKYGGYEDFKSFEDIMLWNKLLKQSVKFYNLNDILVHVRIQNINTRRYGFKYYKYEYNFLKESFKRRYIYFIPFIFNLIIRFFIRLSPKFIQNAIYNVLLRRNHVRN